MKIRLQSLSAAVLSLAVASQAFALGSASYSSELISTRSLGQGGTGVAGVMNDPIAAYTNPAGMTSMAGTQISVGLSYANAGARYESGVTSPGGLGANYTRASQGDISGGRSTSVFIPNFGVTTRLGDSNWTAGLAIVTPYGLETHFNGDSPIRYQTTDARLRLVDVTPSIAYKFSDMFSAGFGVDYYNAIEGQLDKKINTKALNFKLVLAQTGNPGVAAANAVGADASSRLNGNGDGYGYHAGVTVRPNEHHQIGVVYHSSVRVGLSGDVEIRGLAGAAASAGVFGSPDFRTAAAAPLFIPQNIQIGYAYQPNEKTMYEVDAAWYDWYSARQLGVVYSTLTGPQSAVLNSPTSNPTLFNPRRTINFGLGVNHQCTERFAGRLGAYYQAAALPENVFDAAFVDLPRYAATAGASWKFNKDLGLDFAYNAVFFHGRSINNPQSGGSGYSGTLHSFANILSASLTYRTDAHL
jgi:long-chain fatty acid transport protein